MSPRLALDSPEMIRDSLAHCEDSVERHFMARRLAEEHGCTVQTIYRLFPAGRRRRGDAGLRKIEFEEAAIKNVMALLVQSDGDVGLDDAMLVSGIKDASVSCVRRELKRRGFTHKRITQSRRAYRRWRAAHSNEIHQADDTVSRLYYVRRDGTIRRYSGGVAPYKNRPKGPKDRVAKLYLMVLKDDHSGVIYARYYIGKCTANWLDFFFRAWARKKDPRFRLMGVPDAIYVDQDTVFKSALCLRALGPEHLNVEIMRTLPYSPESKGKVENAIHLLTRRFESLIQFFPPEFATVESLNEALEHFCMRRAWTPSRALNGAMPCERWETGLRRDKKLRWLPDEEIRRHLMMVRESRVLDVYLELRLKDRDGAAHYYSLGGIEKAHAWIKQRIEICHFAEDFSKIYVSRDEEEIMVAESAEPLCNEIGNYHGGYINPESEIIREAATRTAVAVPRFLEALPPAANLPRIDPAGEVIDSPMFDHEPPTMQPLEAQKRAWALVWERLGRECTIDENKAFHRRFASGSTVTEDQLTTWVETIIKEGVEHDAKQHAIAG